MTNRRPAPGGLAQKFVRFALVGGLSTLAYGLFAWMAVEHLRLPPLIATIAAYGLVIPLNFLLQRSFAFGSEGAISREVPRFLLVHGFNMAASLATMWVVVDRCGLDYRWGIAATMAIVPGLVFIALNGWVFGAGTAAQRPR